VIALLAALALAGDPSVKPWPIGPGPAYRPAPVHAHTGACSPRGSFAVHVELFAGQRVVLVPAGIGACVDPVHTRVATGVVSVSAGRPHTLGDLFRVWGRPLGAHRLVSFTSRTPVRVYVNGRRATGPVAAVPLTRGAEIVVELGGYVPPHRFFLFPKGSS
jgi:hypothetical protein